MTALETVAPGVHRLAAGLVNLYLLVEDGQVTVLDTGWRTSWKPVREALESLGHGPADVAGVVLTHGHPDHLGAAEALRTNCDVAVRCSADEAPRVRGEGFSSSPFAILPGLVVHLWRPATLGFALHATRHGFLTPKWVKQVEPFAPGTPLDVPGRPLPVATPGHTEGHVSYSLPDRGVLVSGDALVTLDPLTRATGPQVTPAALCTDHDAAVRSLEALEGLEGDVVLPGHGDPWRGTPTEAVRQARARL